MHPLSTDYHIMYQTINHELEMMDHIQIVEFLSGNPY